MNVHTLLQASEDSFGESVLSHGFWGLNSDYQALLAGEGFFFFNTYLAISLSLRW